MTLFKLCKRIEYFYLSLLKVHRSLKEYEFSKEYKINDLSLNRFFSLKTAKIVPEIEKLLQVLEEMILQHTEDLVW